MTWADAIFVIVVALAAYSYGLYRGLRCTDEAVRERARRND